MPTNKNLNNDESSYVISYLQLRKWVGWLGVLLPWVLLTGYYFLQRNCELPHSISHYYYTLMGTYFTGTLCAVGLFLFSYNGYNDEDRITANFAAVCAVLVAFCPTNIKDGISGELCNCIHVCIAENSTRNIIHYAAAALLFLALAYFCLVLFTKTSSAKTFSKEKQTRNLIYRICGWTILVCIAVIGLTSIPLIAELSFVKNFKLLTFVFETIALNAFGYSWLIKGETFFKDK